MFCLYIFILFSFSKVNPRDDSWSVIRFSTVYRHCKNSCAIQRKNGASSSKYERKCPWKFYVRVDDVPAARTAWRCIKASSDAQFSALWRCGGWHFLPMWEFPSILLADHVLHCLQSSRKALVKSASSTGMSKAPIKWIKKFSTAVQQSQCNAKQLP